MAERFLILMLLKNLLDFIISFGPESSGLVLKNGDWIDTNDTFGGVKKVTLDDLVIDHKAMLKREGTEVDCLGLFLDTDKIETLFLILLDDKEFAFAQINTPDLKINDSVNEAVKLLEGLSKDLLIEGGYMNCDSLNRSAIEIGELIHRSLFPPGRKRPNYKPRTFIYD
jgi:hypothetical protein